MSYDNASFTAGIAVGRQLKGWASAGGVLVPALVQPPFYRWAVANGGGTMFETPDAYEAYVDALGVTTVDTGGVLTWSPTEFSEAYARFKKNGETGWYSVNDITTGNLGTVSIVHDNPPYVEILPMPGMTYNTIQYLNGICAIWNGQVKVTGVYTLGKKTSQSDWATVRSFHVSYVESSETTLKTDGGRYNSGIGKGVLAAGDTLAVNPDTDSGLISKPPPSRASYYRADLYPPVYTVTPTGQVQPDASSRAGNLPGAFLVASGTAITVFNQKIVDESAMLLRNPVTGAETAFTAWQYDYRARAYTLTTDGGNITVTFGNNDVRVAQGGSVTVAGYQLPGM